MEFVLRADQKNLLRLALQHCLATIAKRIITQFSERVNPDPKIGPLVARLPAICVLGVGLIPLCGTAQTAHFAYAKSQVAGGFSDPRGIALDGAGAVYVADSNGTPAGSKLWKETPSGGSYTQTLVDGFLTNPDFVAVDGSGNVYVTESTSSGQIVKESFSGGTYTASRIGTGLSYPMGVAVTSTTFINNLIYVADTTDSVYQETPSSSGYLQSRVLSGLGNISGLGVDPNGASLSFLYVASPNGGIVTRYDTPFSPSGGSDVITRGLSLPQGVAGDGQGNVFIAEAQGLQRILKEQIIPAGYLESTVASGLGSLYGLAVDGFGNIYYSDETSKTIQKLQTSGVNFSTQNVGSTSVTTTLTFAFDGATVLGGVSVVTQGAPGLDFANAGGGTCAAGAPYVPGDTCTVTVSFAPTSAGNRYGAVYLYDGSGSVLAAAFVYGTGVGPQVAFLPGTQKVIANGTQLLSLMLNTGGNAYVFDPTSRRVAKLALDGGGAAYVPLVSSQEIQKEVPLPSGQYAQVVVAANLPQPWGVAVDGNGTVYVTDLILGQVLRYNLTTSGTYTGPAVVANGLKMPSGVAVDGAGNVYVADSGNNRVLRESLTATGAYTESEIGSGLNNPVDLAADGTGNLYIADLANGRVLKETPAASGGYTQTVVPLSGSVAPVHVVVDANGNLYVDDNDTRILQFDIADAPTLTFASTVVGTMSSDSPQTLTIQNVGNALLYLSVPASGENPSLSSTDFSLAGGTVINAGQGPTGLQPGEVLTEPLRFAPRQAGALSGSLTFTDNDRNQISPAATQTVLLFGTATPATPNVVVAPLAFAYGSSGANAVLDAMILYGGTAPTGQVTFTIDNLPPVAAVCDQGNPKNCSATNPYATLAGGTHTLAVAEASDANYTSASGTAALTISRIAATVTVPAPQPIAYGAASTLLTAQVGFTGPAAPTGAVTFRIDTGTILPGICGSTTSSAFTCSASYTTSSLVVGTHTITASLAADSNYNGTIGLGKLSVNAPASYQAPTCTLGTVVSGAALNTIRVTPSCTEPQALPISAIIDWGTGLTTAINLPAGTEVSPSYPVSSTQQTYTVTMTATDAAGLVGVSTQQITVQASLPASASGSQQVNTTLPVTPGSAAVARQVTFVCSAISGTINGAVVVNVLPSAYGITCSSPIVTVPAGATNVPVNLTITTNSSPTVAAVHEVRGPALVSMLFPLPGLLPLLLCQRRKTRMRHTKQYIASIGLLSVCLGLNSCSNGFESPPPVLTPKGVYNVTIVEEDLTVPQPAGFVQTSLIVPLSVQ